SSWSAATSRGYGRAAQRPLNERAPRPQHSLNIERSDAARRRASVWSLAPDSRRAVATGIPRARITLATGIGTATRRYLLALAGVAAMSGLIGLIVPLPDVRRISVLYLVVVLAAATRLGRGPAILASFTAFAVYDFFFTEPYHELTIRDPEEWV